MRRSRDVIAVIVLMLVFVVGGLLLTRSDTGYSRQVGKAQIHDPSVYNDRAFGSKGVFDWIRTLGYQPAAWRQDWEHLSQSQSPILLIIDPMTQEAFSGLTGSSDTRTSGENEILQAGDAQTLRQWLQSGHTAVLFSSRIPSGHIPGGSSEDDQDTFGDALDVIVETATGGGRSEFAPLQPVPATDNVISIHTDADVRIRRRALDGIALFGDGSGPVVLDIPVGQGRLVIVADSNFVSNTNLPRSENAVFLANLLKSEAHRGDTILFDEYHHGDVDLASGETIWSALGHPLQLSLIQLFLALAVIIGVVAVRFGAPVPLMQGMHRSSAEYVASLASLYQRAQAAPAALDVLYRQFLRDLASRLALTPDVSLELLAETAARRGQVDKQKLRGLLAACEHHLDTGKVTDGELLDLARRMGQIRKEIGIA